LSPAGPLRGVCCGPRIGGWSIQGGCLSLSLPPPRLRLMGASDDYAAGRPCCTRGGLEPAVRGVWLLWPGGSAARRSPRRLATRCAKSSVARPCARRTNGADPRPQDLAVSHPGLQASARAAEKPLSLSSDAPTSRKSGGGRGSDRHLLVPPSTTGTRPIADTATGDLRPCRPCRWRGSLPRLRSATDRWMGYWVDACRSP
jgi:hypothetical protein